MYCSVNLAFLSIIKSFSTVLSYIKCSDLIIAIHYSTIYIYTPIQHPYMQSNLHLSWYPSLEFVGSNSD